MYAFIIQFVNFLTFSIPQPFLIFFLVTWMLWILKLILSLMHRNYDEKYRPKFSVIVPVYKENPEIFDLVLKKIKAENPVDLIVAIDNGDKDMISIAEKYTSKILPLPKVGKRKAMLEASKLLNKEIEVVIICDSDTIWTPSTLNILNPFKDKKVGGVTGVHEINNPRSSIARRISAWMEGIRFLLVVPAQQMSGNVMCLPGRALAVRSELFQFIIKDIAEDSYLGVSIHTGDDRAITDGILMMNYKTVFQSNSLVITEAPDTLYSLFNQQLRWYRSVIRETVRKFGFYAYKNFLATIWSMEFIFGALIFLGIITSASFKNYNDFQVVTGEVDLVRSVPLHILFTLIGFFLSYAIRQLPYLVRNMKEVFFLPIFAISMILILLPAKVMALFTFLNQGWNTRKQDSIVILNSRIAGLSFGILVFVMAFPLGYLGDFGRYNVPVPEVLAGNALEYYNQNNPDAAIIALDGNGSILSASASKDQNLEIKEESIPSYAVVSQLVAPEKIAVANQNVQQPKAKVEESKTISEIANPGDSIYKVARRIIKSYVLEKNLKIDNIQKTFVENQLVGMYGATSLNVGDIVEFSKSDIQQVIDQSKTLSSNDRSNWAYFANLIVFDY